jgi:hypothetical protein
MGTNGGRRPGAGRPVGARNKRSTTVELWARGVLEDPAVRKQMMEQLRQGTLPPVLVTMLFAYAYGKPREQQRDDEAFLQELLSVVLKHVGTADARQEIRAVIEAHHTGTTGLRVVG